MTRNLEGAESDATVKYATGSLGGAQSTDGCAGPAFSDGGSYMSFMENVRGFERAYASFLSYYLQFKACSQYKLASAEVKMIAHLVHYKTNF